MEILIKNDYVSSPDRVVGALFCAPKGCGMDPTYGRQLMVVSHSGFLSLHLSPKFTENISSGEN